LSRVEKTSKSAWIVAYTLKVVEFVDGVLTLRFISQSDLETFKTSGQAPDVLRKAITDELGVTVKFKPLVEVVTPIAEAPAAAAPAPAAPATTPAAEAPTTPIEVQAEPEAEPEVESAEEKPAKATKSRKADVPDAERYGESILREFGAKPLDNPSGGR
jgi:ribosomal protein L12E/L44/L45/RPP1/RPP2